MQVEIGSKDCSRGVLKLCFLLLWICALLIVCASELLICIANCCIGSSECRGTHHNSERKDTHLAMQSSNAEVHIIYNT